MSLRSLERSIIRSECSNTNEFREKWKKYHDAKIDTMKNNNMNVIINKPKKKQNHWDNGRLAIRQWKAMKEMVADMLKKKQSENEQVEAVNE